jgi:hypothetical protein
MGHGSAETRRRADDFVGAIGGSEDASHTSIENRDDVLDAGELCRFHKPAQESDGGGVDELVDVRAPKCVDRFVDEQRP